MIEIKIIGTMVCHALWEGDPSINEFLTRITVHVLETREGMFLKSQRPARRRRAESFVRARRGSSRVEMGEERRPSHDYQFSIQERIGKVSNPAKPGTFNITAETAKWSLEALECIAAIASAQRKRAKPEVYSALGELRQLLAEEVAEAMTKEESK